MDAAELLGAIESALKAEVGRGYSSIKQFVRSQGQKLAEQAIFLAEQRATGSLAGSSNDSLYEFFLEGLKTNAENLAKSVAMLTVLTIERAWNAIANVVWGALSGILKAAGLPAVLIPTAPPHA